MEKYKDIKIYSFEGSHLARNALFVLRKSDLPNIGIKPIDDISITKYSLNKISQTINLYSSVIDLNNTSEEVYNENKQDKTDDELKKSVLMSIFILAEFKWKKDIEVIQLKRYEEYYQNGIANKLEDVHPFDKVKSKN